MFKCSVFVQGLMTPEYGRIRTRILSKLEQNSKISLQLVTEECEPIENLQHNTEKIEECNMSKINAVKQKQRKEKFACKMNSCYSCGQIHYIKECPFRRKECFVAKKVTGKCIAESQKIKRGKKWKIQLP